MTAARLEFACRGLDGAGLKGPINAEAVGSPVEDEWKLQINRLLRESSISPSEEHCWCEAVQYIQLDVK